MGQKINHSNNALAVCHLNVVVPQHPPEIVGSVGQRTLGGNVVDLFSWSLKKEGGAKGSPTRTSLQLAVANELMTLARHDKFTELTEM